MNDIVSNSYTSFNGHRQIASGSLETVALAVKRALENGAVDPVLTFDDSTGRSIEIDTRGSDADVLARLAQSTAIAPPEAVQSVSEAGDGDAPVGEARGRGRPKLGVVPREVTLLPRHWE